ncbi:MAG: hypothetical protein ACP5GX_06840 [Anaerolineae bacterium]
MFLIDFLFALAVALLLTAIFAVLFRTTGPWSSFWIFLAVIFLAAWAGGLWVAPLGPTLLGAYWLPFLLVGLFFALLMAAATPVARAPRTPREAVAEIEAEREAATAFSVFFWILLVGLLIAVILGYAL